MNAQSATVQILLHLDRSASVISNALGTLGPHIPRTIALPSALTPVRHTQRPRLPNRYSTPGYDWQDRNRDLSHSRLYSARMGSAVVAGTGSVSMQTFIKVLEGLTAARAARVRRAAIAQVECKS